MLTAEGPDGRPRRYPVAGVIGVEPLIQYLVAFEGGRLQPTALAYDVKRREWFDLHAPEGRRPEEWGHWTNRGMTWNLQCAPCHVTDFRKNYDPERDVYASRWSEEGVGCEACHGPRAEHVERARAGGDAGAGRGTGPDASRVPVDACAPCHSRRRQLAEGFAVEPGGPRAGSTFLDFYDPVLPDDPVYWADGQVRDEDYEWVSFLESRMHAKGVVCSDCHDPHSGKIRSEGNPLCLRCHKPELGTPAHTFHEAGSPGSLCVSCHMPQTTYMLRHPRRDHAMTTPLPELTLKLGIPNACSRCHDRKDAAWAVRWGEAWYGKKGRPAVSRAIAVAAAREGREEAVPGLLALLADSSAPPVWRGAAASLLEPWVSRKNVGAALARATSDSDPLVRARAARAFSAQEAPRSLLLKLLHDPVRLVRIEAAWALRRVRPDGLGSADASALSRARSELLAAARLNADNPAGRHGLALYYSALGQPASAEGEYRAALALDPRALPSRLNLAVLLSEGGRMTEAVSLLEDGTRLSPEEASLHFALGLAYAESGRRADAVCSLERAVHLDPGDAEARRALETLLRRAVR